MNIIAIPKIKINKEGGVVILSLREYQRLCEMAVPTYYLKGGAAKRLDKLVEEGLGEYERGETINAVSLKEALKLHGKKDKRNRVF